MVFKVWKPSRNQNYKSKVILINRYIRDFVKKKSMLIFHTFKSVIVYSVLDGLSVLCIQKHCKEENYDLLSVDPWTWFGFILYNIQYTIYNIQYTI